MKLDIIVGSMKLDDQFEWDLDNQDASPEQFADVYVKELGLGGEFKCVSLPISTFPRKFNVPFDFGVQNCNRALHSGTDPDVSKVAVPCWPPFRRVCNPRRRSPLIILTESHLGRAYHRPSTVVHTPVKLSQ